MIAQAQVINNYENISLQDLADKYLDEESSYIKDGYIAAICLRYWSKIYSYYNKSRTLHIELEDVYEWVLECIMVALDICPWRKETDKLYKDPNGFDKVFNRCLACARVNAYQYSNRQKRKDGHFINSLNEMEEIMGDAYASEFVDSFSLTDKLKDIEISNFVKELFNKKEYIKCFIIFGAIEYQTDTPEKIRRFLMGEDKHVVEFSSLYNLPLKDVAKAATYLNNLKYSSVMSRIDKQLFELRKMIEV